MRSGHLVALGAALCVLACGQSSVPSSTASPVPTAARPPTLVPTPEPIATLTPPTLTPVRTPTATPTRPSSPLTFPTQSEVELLAARYSSSPPFDVAFTFEVPGRGWYSAHLHGEFLDVMRFDGPDRRVPTRWVAWAHPDTVHGVGAVPAGGLSPEQAAATVAANDELDPTAPRTFTFAGLDGVELDVHTSAPNVPVFGGPDGDFALQPSHDARLGFVSIDDELIIVMCLGAPAELDAACADVQPILDSVQL